MLSAPKPPAPSLNSLKHFEAAARHGSFVKAAAELCVSPGAVAQQVRHLEEWLGRRLFIRLPHGVALTAEAELVAKHFEAAFDALGGAVQMLRSVSAPDQLRIAALPCVAQLWLPQRLLALKDEYADLEISVTAMEAPPDFDRDPFHLGIFFMEHGAQSWETVWLAQDTLFPVCSPALALATPEDLAHQTLLHDGTWKSYWRLWLEQALQVPPPAHRGPVFSLYSIALQTAVDGGGVLVGRGALVAKALQQGLLRKPFQLEVRAPNRLALILPGAGNLAPRHEQFVAAIQRLPA